MKLLFDANLPKRLVRLVEIKFPSSLHVVDAGLLTASDQKIWDYARSNGFTIVSKDSDFADLVILRGHPPIVVWLRLGNASVERITVSLKAKFNAIEMAANDPAAGIIEIYEA
jgi:predicted nuclease of predicted toxin-antitoxin system